MIRNNLYTKYFSDISSLAEKLNDALDSIHNCFDNEQWKKQKLDIN